MDFLTDLAAKSTLLLVAVFLSLFLLRRASAGIRHWIISWSMIALLVLPLLIFLLPELQLNILPDTKAGSPLTEQAALPVTEEQSVAATSLQLATIPAPEPPLPMTRMEAERSDKSPLFSGFSLLLVLWLAGAAWMLVRTGMGLLQLRRLKKQATPLHILPIAAVLPHGRIYVADHPGVRTPMTWGIFTPIILLPRRVRNFSAAEQETILLHEWMHIRRRDFLLHLITMLTVSLYWFHPLVWVLKNRQLLEREKACDEAVISSGIRPADYAEKLVAIARKLLPARPEGLEMAVYMAQGSQIRQRIVAILEKHAGVTTAPAGHRWFPVAILLSSLPLLAAVEPAARCFPVLGHLPFVLLEGTQQDLPSEIAPSEQPQVPPVRKATDISNEARLPQGLALSAEPVVLPALPTQSLTVMHKRERPALEFQPRPIDLPEGWYGHWQTGRSNYRVYTKGDFRVMPAMPYIETNTADGMVIVEEQRGAKTYRLVITKAAYDGGLVQSFRHGQPNSWSGLRQGDPLYFWTINDEWIFLGKGRDEWMRQNLELVAQKLAHPREAGWQAAGPDDEQWSKLIEAQEVFKKNRVIPDAALPVWNERTGKMEEPFVAAVRQTFDLFRLPYLPAKGQATSGSVRKVIGFDTATRTTTGWSGGSNRTGMRYATLIHTNERHGKLANFNFYLRDNMCAEAALKLYLYAVQDGLPAHRLLEEPALIHIGDQTGWIQKDLSTYHLPPSETMLVVLELADYRPKRGKAGIFFSEAHGGSKHHTLLSEDFSWDFVLVPLAAYFSLE